jgi:hypothetical protein
MLFSTVSSLFFNLPLSFFKIGTMHSINVCTNIIIFKKFHPNFVISFTTPIPLHLTFEGLILRLILANYFLAPRRVLRIPLPFEGLIPRLILANYFLVPRRVLRIPLPFEGLIPRLILANYFHGPRRVLGPRRVARHTMNSCHLQCDSLSRHNELAKDENL